MKDAQYIRIERIAGGKSATNREFIRACRTRLNKHGKSRKLRTERQKWIIQGLRIKTKT